MTSPLAALKAQGTVAGSGASAVLTVNTDNAGSNGLTNTTDFGDGTTATTATANHAFAAGALKQTITETSVEKFFGLTSTTQVQVDATGGSVVTTSSVPMDLNAGGAWVKDVGSSWFDLSKILPPTADPAGLSGTCDHGAGALPLTVDAANKTATCNWTTNAGGVHEVTLVYTDAVTGLKSSIQANLWVPVQPLTVFKTTVLAPGTVRVDVTGSAMDTGTGYGTGILDWGDGTTTSVQYPLRGQDLYDHTYGTLGTKTISYSITDRFGESATTSSQVDVSKATVTGAQVTRYAGDSRYGTGVAVSQAAFPGQGSAGAVVLARGDVFADALAGIPLAKYKNAPLLLTQGGPNATTLNPNVEAEIKRVLPADKNHTVYILGGISAIPQQVQDYISSTLGYNVVRLSGGTRYDTALDIAKNPLALNDPKHVVVARGDDFADALAAGPFASDYFGDSAGVPAAILLSSGAGTTAPPTVDPATAAYVTDKAHAAPDQAHPAVAAIGGGAVKAVAGLLSSNPPQLLISGSDRYETAAKVAYTAFGNPATSTITTPEIGLASGMGFPDALTGGAYMALKGGPLLLTDPKAATPAVSAAAGAVISADKASVLNTSVFGGVAVIPDAASQSVIQLEGLTASAYRVVHVSF